MNNGDSFVKVVSVIEGDYRNTNITHNFHDMRETASFMDQLNGLNLKNVKWIRVVPTAVDFTDPGDAARGLDGVTGRKHW